MSIWESLATAGVTIGGLAGGGVILWVLQKPRLQILKVSDSGWYYTYKEDKIDSTVIYLSVFLVNSGTDDTNIAAIFKMQSMTFIAQETIPFEGKGMRKEVPITLVLPIDKGNPKDGDELRGWLKLKVWGNRRLLIFGKGIVQKEITVPFIDRRDMVAFRRG